MKNILFLCVTYNSYKELLTYVGSIDRAAQLAADKFAVDVLVADNTTDGRQVVDSHFDSLQSFRVVPTGSNLGYFGGVKCVMSQVDDITRYDFVAISNVDLLMPEDFFGKLDALKVDEQVGWVANSILSGLEKRDRNPKIMRRYSEKRLKQLRLLFRYPLLHQLYTRTLYLRKKHRPQLEAQEIYAGHGSFILLTRRFVSAYPVIDYPVFLFCEEIYLAELCRKAQLTVRYEPSVIIEDSEHCSTGKMGAFYYKCNYEAIDYILKTYYADF